VLHEEQGIPFVAQIPAVERDGTLPEAHYQLAFQLLKLSDGLPPPVSVEGRQQLVPVAAAAAEPQRLVRCRLIALNQGYEIFERPWRFSAK
jgi:hypothetical protein